MKKFSLVDLAKIEFTPEQIDRVACKCHEANRQYCLSLKDTSQPSWHDAEDWQKESARNGVIFQISRGFPSPEMSHQNWMNHKLGQGWKYGEKKDPELKTHPCMVHYNQLPESQRKKDHIFRETVISEFKRIAAEIEESMANTHKQIPDRTPAGDAPSVTAEGIREKIVKVDYVRHGLLIWAVVHMENGFCVTGDPSACVSPDNFDEKKGREIAYANAFDKIWALEGYLLKQKLYEGRLTQAAASATQQVSDEERAKIVSATAELSPAIGALQEQAQ